MRHPYWLLGLALATGSASVFAQWVSTGGPLGGLGYDVRIHPADKTRMFVTDNYAGVVRSSDGGATWRASNTGISIRGGPTGNAYPIFSLTVDPNNPDMLWAGTNAEGGQFGIFKSTDGGATWALKSGGLVPDPFGIVFRGFTVEAGNSNVVYAMAELPTDRQGREFNRTRGRVYKTSDGGASWAVLWEGDSLARYLIVDPADKRTLYLSTGIFDREAANSDCANGVPGGVGILKSSDGGTTWTTVNHGLTSLYVGSLRMHPAKSGILFAAAGNNACSGGFEDNQLGGLFRTADAGATWSKVIARDIMTTVNFAPANPDVLYAGSAQAFYRSADGGLTWTTFAKPGGAEWGPTGVRAGVPIDVVVDPADANLLYANNYGGGVFRSTDGAHTWSIWSKGYSGAQIHAVHIPAASRSTILAIGRSGPYRSVDYGGNWTGIGNGQAEFPEWNTLVADPRDARVILLADEHQGKLLRSTDAGANFTVAFTHPLANPANVATRQGFKTLVFAPSNPNVVYAGLARERGTIDDPAGTPAGRVIYKSTDGGSSFVQGGAGLDGKNVRRLAVHPTQADTVWAATSGGVFKTGDGGNTWTSLGLAGRNIAALAVDAADNLLIAGEKDAGIWLSEDGGSHWSGPLTTGFNNPNPYIMALVFDGAVLYAADYYSGVYRSTDKGRNWTAFPDETMAGLSMRTAKDLAAADGLVYVATEGGGVFRHGGLPTTSQAAFSGSASGPLAARTLTVDLQAPLADLGTTQQIFVAALLGGQYYFLTPQSWQPWTGGTFPAYVNDSLASQTIRVLDGSLDLSGAVGAVIYVGYGSNGEEMLAAGRYGRVHVVE